MRHISKLKLHNVTKREGSRVTNAGWPQNKYLLIGIIYHTFNKTETKVLQKICFFKIFIIVAWLRGVVFCTDLEMCFWLPHHEYSHLCPSTTVIQICPPVHGRESGWPKDSYIYHCAVHLGEVTSELSAHHPHFTSCLGRPLVWTFNWILTENSVVIWQSGH